MSISFAGIDLLLEDPEGKVRTWLDQHLNELHASIFCTDNVAIGESRYGGVTNPISPVSSPPSSGWPAYDTPTVRMVGLPVGNYPKPPKPRINSLYWPTGGTRWANALFLIRGDVIASLTEALQNEKAGTLTIGDSAGNSFSTSMYMLAPRPISADGVTAGDRLWLLPLVDARYFWQYYHVDLYAPSTWAEALKNIVGVSPSDNPQLGDPVPLAYGRPSAVEFVRDFENAALLTDAVALTLQRRIVGSFGITTNRFGSYTAQTADQATTQVVANLGAGFNEIAGGDFSAEAGVLGNVPSQVYVTYGNTNGDRVGGYGKAAITGTTTNGGSKVFHCSKVGTGAITASGEYLSGFEAALAAEIAGDYYNWQLFQYDVTYAGIVPWVPSGCDDYVRWDMSVKGKGKRKKLVCQTRAVSMPPNFGFEALPIDPLGSSSSSSGSSSQSSSSQSSQSSQSSASSASSGSNSATSSSMSGSSTSVTTCKCGYSTFLSDGAFWNLIFSNCDPAYRVRPSTAPGVAGTRIDVCCRCPSSSSSSVSSRSSSQSSGSSSQSSGSSASSTTSSNVSSGGSQTSSGSSATSSQASSVTSSASSQSSASSGSSGSSGSQSSDSSGSQSSTSQSSGSQSGSGNSGTSSGGSQGSQGSSGGSTTSSGGSGTSSGSGSSGSGTSSGSGGSAGSSGSGGSSGSSGSGTGCIQVVTDVSCSGGNLVVTKTGIVAATC